MALIHDPEVWQKRLAALPLASYEAGEKVFAEGTKTGLLLILKSGAVSIVKGGTEIATVAEPGAVFGELSALLDQPHSADVRALEASEFYVADAAALLGQDPAALLYVTMIAASRRRQSDVPRAEEPARLRRAAGPDRRNARQDRRIAQRHRHRLHPRRRRGFGVSIYVSAVALRAKIMPSAVDHNKCWDSLIVPQ
jgi:CRP-like cAMP-binding protein